MNYIKKKIKGHKKGHDDDDDFDFDPPVATSGESPKPALEKDSEEWKFFQQLTQRVQDTVQKSQDTLEKLKDSTTVEEISKPDYEFIDESAPRPPSQSTSTTWVSFSGAQKAGSDPLVAPPKPKPPRPPPVRPPVVETPAPPVNSGVSLLDEFGFDKEPEPSLRAAVPINGILILDDDEPIDGDDPFDTTFADETLASASLKSDDLLGLNAFDIKSGASTTTNEVDFLGDFLNEGPVDLISATGSADLISEFLAPEPKKNNDILSVQPIDIDTFDDIEDSGPDPFDTSFVSDINTESVIKAAKQTVSEVVNRALTQAVSSPPQDEIDFFAEFDVQPVDSKPTEVNDEAFNGFFDSHVDEIVDNVKSSPDENIFLGNAETEQNQIGSTEQSPESQKNDVLSSLTSPDFKQNITESLKASPENNNEEMSNPFLPQEPSGASTPFGGTRSRRMSTNPFEEDTVDEPGDLLGGDFMGEMSFTSDAAKLDNNIFTQINNMNKVESPTDVAEGKLNNTISGDAFGILSQTESPPQASDPFDVLGDVSSAIFPVSSRKSSGPSETMDVFASEDAKPAHDLFGFTDENKVSHPFGSSGATDDPFSMAEDLPAEMVVKPTLPKPAAVRDVISSLEKIASFAADDDDEVMDFASTLSKRGSSDVSVTSLNQGLTEDDTSIMSGKLPDEEMLKEQDFAPLKSQTDDLFSFSNQESKPAEQATSPFNPFGGDDIPMTTPGGFMIPESKADMFSGTAEVHDSFMNKTDAGRDFMAADPFDTIGAAVILGDAASHPKDLFDLSPTAPSSDPFNFEPVKDSIPITDTTAFEAFAARFEQAIDKFEEGAKTISEGDIFDPFGGGSAPPTKSGDEKGGFGVVDMFDPFLSMTGPPENTPTKMPPKQSSQDSFDDDDDVDFSVVIRPKMIDKSEASKVSLEPPPLLPPPPKSPIRDPNQQISRFNPFDKDFGFSMVKEQPVLADVSPPKNREPPPALGEAGVKKSESIESPTTPLYDEDTSMPLEEFPPKVEVDGWEMMLRQPNKKKITGNRFWKKVYVRLSENSILQLFNKKEDNDPFQELPLQACYSLSEVGAQQYDAYGKIFTVKLHYIFYRERVGVRPGQISKVMHGQITSVGQLAKLGLPLEHAPQVSQLLKIGTQTYDELKTFVQVMEDALFHLTVHRDRALTYKTEEVQVTVHDELYVEQKKTGTVDKQNARVRVFFIAFISGMPDVEVGINDLQREGKEVVGRYDIIPVVTEEWIRLENCEFHSCVSVDEFVNKRVVKLHPPDACYFELLRFRIRPPRNRELPLQIRVTMRISSMRVEMRCDVLVTGYSSRKHGQVPCENVEIRFPLPECWIYLFRVEKHFRYGSLKSAARKPGKIKGLERIMGTAASLDPSLIEVSTGQAKYEHSFKSIVWRIPRLPKEGQGAYTTQLFLLKLELTSFDQIPETFEKYVYAQFTMPATTVSHTTVRSVSVTNETPPEKYVKYLSKHEYRIEIDMLQGEEESEYSSAIAAAMNATNNQSAPSESSKISSSHEEESD